MSRIMYVFIFVELGTRSVYLAGVIVIPDSPWVAQRARQYVWELPEHDKTFRHLIHDRDSKYMEVFDSVFFSKGINVIRTPVQAPTTAGARAIIDDSATSYPSRWPDPEA